MSPVSVFADQVDRAIAALEEDDSHPARWRARVFTLMARDQPGDRAAAVATARRAKERFPDDADMMALLARALLHRGEYGAAVHEARRALSTNLSSGEAHLVYGRVRLGEWKRDEARRHLELAAELLPADPDPLFHLARLYEWEKLYPLAADTWEAYQRVRRGEPATAGPPGGADEGRVALLRALGPRTPFVIEGKAVSTTVPIKQARSGLYLVRVRANDGAEVWFDLDTGSEGVLISRTLMRKLRLKQISRTAVTGIGGEVVSSTTAILDTLQIGDFRIGNVPIEVLDRFPQHKGKPVAGSIGQSLLREFVVTFNFPAKTFTLEMPRRHPGGTGAERAGEGVPALKHTVPMRYPSITWGAWETSGEIPLLWDTGAALSVLDAQVVEESATTPELESRQRRGKDGTGHVIAYRRMAQPARLLVGDLAFQVQPAVIDLSGVNRGVPYLGGIVGADAMRDYVVTFDYFRGELRLLRGGPNRFGTAADD